MARFYHPPNLPEILANLKAGANKLEHPAGQQNNPVRVSPLVSAFPKLVRAGGGMVLVALKAASMLLGLVIFMDIGLQILVVFNIAYRKEWLPWFFAELPYPLLNLGLLLADWGGILGVIAALEATPKRQAEKIWQAFTVALPEVKGKLAQEVKTAAILKINLSETRRALDNTKEVLEKTRINLAGARQLSKNLEETVLEHKASLQTEIKFKQELATRLQDTTKTLQETQLQLAEARKTTATATLNATYAARDALEASSYNLNKALDELSAREIKLEEELGLIKIPGNNTHTGPGAGLPKRNSPPNSNKRVKNYVGNE